MVYASSAATYGNLPSPQTLVKRVRKIIMDILVTQC